MWGNTYEIRAYLDRYTFRSTFVEGKEQAYIMLKAMRRLLGKQALYVELRDHKNEVVVA